jgi:hypothetical protein
VLKKTKRSEKGHWNYLNEFQRTALVQNEKMKEDAALRASDQRGVESEWIKKTSLESLLTTA